MSNTPMIDKMLKNYHNLIREAQQELILEFLEDLESDKFIWEIYDKWEEKLK